MANCAYNNSTLNTLSGGDLLEAYIASQGDNRRFSLTTLLAFMQDNLAFPTVTGIAEFTKQYAAPSATGFSITVGSGVATQSDNFWLIITPSAGYAAGTIVLPAVAGVVDKQEILINCTQQVTTLTVDGNGAVAVTGAPVTLGAEDYFRLKYDALVQTWYRVG